MLAEITFRMRLLSYLGGICMGALGYLILENLGIEASWAWGLVIGSLVALVLCLMQYSIFHHEAMKQYAACQRAGGETLLFTQGKVQYGSCVRRGYFVLTPTTLCIYLWSRHPYLETKIPLEDISVEYALKKSNWLLFIVSRGEEALPVYGRKLDTLLEKLRQCGCKTEPIERSPLKEGTTNV